MFGKLVVLLSFVAVPTSAQTISQSPSLSTASLSNGLRAGMSADQVVTTIRGLPDIKSAKTKGSSKKPAVDVVYTNGKFAELDGFEFTFKFEFYESKLIWVDLDGVAQCDAVHNELTQKTLKSFNTIYGKPDASGVFHKGNTAIYVRESVAGPAIPRTITGPFSAGTNAINDLAARRSNEASMQACGSATRKTMSIRFKNDPPMVAAPVDPATAASSAVVVRKKFEQEAARRKLDADRLKID